MKIEFSENDKKYIDKVNEGNIDALFVHPDQTYYIEFKVTDIGKANGFVAELLKPKNNTISKELGIDVSCIALSNPDRKKAEIKEILQQAIRELDAVL